MIPIRYIEPVYRPPSESESLILPVTDGCSWNHCTYCDMYRDKSFAVRPLAETLEDIDRAADVLDVMQPDDAADLVAELPTEQAAMLLEKMEPEEADDVRRLLSYQERTAGGMMTTEPVVLPPEATIAQALAAARGKE